MSNFDRAFAFVVGEEGGYSNDPDDPGNWTGGKCGVGELKGTKFGISAASYPTLDIAGLTLADAKAIYLRDFWNALFLDTRPYGPALVLFDCGVNQGIGRAKALLSQVATSSQPFIVAFQAERILHYASLPKWPKYGRGWMRRIIRSSIEASAS